MPLELNRSTSQQIDSLSRERTVFFFSVGPLEDHGPHLPLGLDLIEAEAVSKKLAERLEKELPGWIGVLLPGVPLGIEGNTTHFALTVRPHVLRDWLVDGATALRRQGFQHFACISGHLGPKQLTAIEEAGKILARRSLFGILRKSSFVSASSALATPTLVKASPFWPDPAEHGGARDTSVALFLSPTLVEPLHAHLPPVEREALWLTRGIHRASGKTKGYWGNPKDAASEQGKQTLDQQVETIWVKLRANLAGTFAPSAFRSWYSIVPSNRSFFKSWILALFVLIILGIWASYSLHGYS